MTRDIVIHMIIAGLITMMTITVAAMFVLGWFWKVNNNSNLYIENGYDAYSGE